MNLKKSDKIVAIIGVIILISSAALIAVFFSTEDDIGEPTDEEISFIVNWKEDHGSMEILEKWAGAEAYVDPFTISENTDGAVIKDISIRLEWEDDNTWGLLFKRGYDTLTGSISLDGVSLSFEETTGEGNVTIDFALHNEPIIKEIKDPEITSKEQAEKYLLEHEQVKDKNTATFTPEISIQKGETFKLLAIIRSTLNLLKDNGDTFNLYIDYTYYYPEIPIDDIEENSPPAETPPTGTAKYSLIGTPMGKH